MSNYELDNCDFHCGFGIFVECGEEYSDAELMKQLGISGYSPLPPEDSPDQPIHSDRCVQFASDGRWVHISDDGGYTLYKDYCGSGQLRDRIKILARRHNIFVRTLGDADDSFELEYFEGSKLRRHYKFMDPCWQPKDCVVLNYGEALPGEEELSVEVDMFKKLKGIEDALGIETDIEKLSFHTYTKPYNKPSFLYRLLRWI